MTRPPSSQATGETASVPEPRPRRLGWQLLQIALLAVLLLVGMYEVDLDAKALAESRARVALLSAFESGAGRGAPAPASPGLEEAVEAYTRACGECAEPVRCEETIRSIREDGRMPAGRGPCKAGIFERWNADAR